MTSLYFVYGTLKKDMRNHSVLKKINANFLAQCKTADNYPMFDLGNGFPYLQEEPGNGNIIHGELFEIDNKFEKHLDDFEGVPELYYRGTITIIYNKQNILVNCYFITDSLSNEELNQTEMLDNWID